MQETNRFHALRRPLTAAPALAKLAAMIPPLEIYTVKYRADAWLRLPRAE
jgi:hypothetical protein